jgi:hypothetical protein
MYSRYRPCPPTAVQKASTPYCPPVVGSGPGAIAESARLQQRVAACGSAWVQTVPGPAQCGIGEPSGGVIRVAVPPAGPLPVVEVGTVPASQTTKNAANVITTGSDTWDPYNPKTRFNQYFTRFSQYFPPDPIPAPCPFRMPSNDPKPSTRECLPIQRFMGSAQEAAMSAAPAPAPSLPSLPIPTPLPGPDPTPEPVPTTM